jgi:DNA repair protein SbcC/Rad50
MLKGLYFTDSHDMGRNPGARIDNYHQAILNKFNEVAEVAIANDVDYIVHGGDWFDAPRVAYSLYNQHQRILRRIRSKGIKVYLVPGNHDLYGYELKTLDQTAIGGLARSGLVTLLTRRKSHTLTDGKITVEIHGREYDKDIDMDPDDYGINANLNADYNFLFSHGMLLQKPFHPDVRYTLTKDVFTDANLVANGHYHPGYEVHEHNGTVFTNPGSTGRDEGSVDNEKRIPQYMMIEADDSGFDVEYIEFACAKAGKDVFDRTQLVQKKQTTRYLEAFEQTIEDALAFDEFDPKDILQKSKGIEQPVLDEAMAAVVTHEKIVHDGKLDGYVEKAKAIGIKTIELTNFQSHKKTVVELNEKGLNALTGGSDTGKSAIIRALRWVLYNEPRGADFIRHGETRATATVTFTDGSSITRSRTNSAAGEYIVRDSSGKELEFKGFGNNPPIDIANTHQMPKVELSTGIERSLNFSYQLDGHFLLSESPAVRANTIGRLTGVHVVDAAIKEKSKEIRNLTVATNATEKQIGELDEQLKEYESLADEEKNLNVIKGLVTTATNIENELSDLELLNDEYNHNTTAVQTLKADLKKFSTLDKGLLKLHEAEALQKELVELKDLLHDYKTEKATISEIKLDLMDYEDIDEGVKLLDDAEVLASEVRELKSLNKTLRHAEEEEARLVYRVSTYASLDKIDLDAIKEEHADIKELKVLYKEYDRETLEVSDLKIEMQQVDARLEEFKDDMAELIKKMGSKCPTCHQDISEHAFEEMLHHV